MNNFHKTQLQILVKYSAMVALFSFAALNAFAGVVATDENRRTERTTLVPAGMDTIVVARVGNLNITADELLLSYEFGPAFVKRSKNPRARHLNFMINEKLLALEGYARRLERDPQVTASLQEVEGDLATEELYRDDVLSQVSVDSSEMAAAIAQECVHLEMKWLFTPARQAMDAHLKQLAQGVSFDALFKTQLNDSVFADNRSLEITKFRLEEKNPTLAQVVDTLKYGAVSQVIETPDGFYVVEITNIWTNPVMTETERTKLEYDLERALIQRKAETLSDRYVDTMMRERNPLIVRRTFNTLRAMMGKITLPREKYNDWNLSKDLMSEAGPVDSAKVDDYRGTTLVRLNDQNFSLEDFWTWHQARRPYIRFSTTAAQSFSASLQQMVWRSVRDKLLIARALQRGLQNRRTVQRQKQWWEEKIVYARDKEEMLKSLNLTDERVRQFYENHRQRYRDQKGNVLPFAQAQSTARQDCYEYELTKNMLHRLNKLKSQYPVEINQGALDALNISTAPEPKAIDVIVAKKGGTFPRPAFPTIDFDWQRWE